MLTIYTRPSGITASTIARIAGNIHAGLSDDTGHDQAIMVAVEVAFALVEEVEARMQVAAGVSSPEEA